MKEKLKKVETDLDETQNLIDELEKNIIRVKTIIIIYKEEYKL